MSAGLVERHINPPLVPIGFKISPSDAIRMVEWQL
jgi:hypothetical protein